MDELRKRLSSEEIKSYLINRFLNRSLDNKTKSKIIESLTIIEKDLRLNSKELIDLLFDHHLKNSNKPKTTNVSDSSRYCGACLDEFIAPKPFANFSDHIKKCHLLENDGIFKVMVFRMVKLILIHQKIATHCSFLFDYRKIQIIIMNKRSLMQRSISKNFENFSTRFLMLLQRKMRHQRLLTNVLLN